MLSAFTILLITLLYFTMLLFIFFYAVPNQNQYLTICRTPLIVCNNMELIKHLLVNSDRQTLYSHKPTSKIIELLFILFPIYDIMFKVDAKHI